MVVTVFSCVRGMPAAIRGRWTEDSLPLRRDSHCGGCRSAPAQSRRSLPRRKKFSSDSGTSPGSSFSVLNPCSRSSRFRFGDRRGDLRVRVASRGVRSATSARPASPPSGSRGGVQIFDVAAFVLGFEPQRTCVGSSALHSKLAGIHGPGKRSVSSRRMSRGDVLSVPLRHFRPSA